MANNNYEDSRKLIASKPFEIMILWHPTAKQADEDATLATKIVVEKEMVLSSSDKTAAILASKKIPDEYNNQLDQLEVLVRPF